MRKPFVIPQLWLVLFGLLAAAVYVGDRSTIVPRLSLMHASDVSSTTTGGDFRLFWAQGYLAASGKPLAVYSAADIAAVGPVASLRGKIDIRPSFYPPNFVLLMEALGRLDFARAWHLYSWGSVLLLAFVTVLAFRREYYALPLLAGFGGLWCALSFGQNSIVLATLYLGVAAWSVRHEMAGGLLLALASFKPHLGILAPLMLLWRGQYATIMWAILGSAALAGLTVFYYSPQMWLAYFDVLRAPAERLLDFSNVQGSNMISLYATLRQHGLEPVYALAAQGVLALAAVQMLWRICRRALDPMLPVAALVTATLLVMPHAYSYDLVLLFIPIMVIVKRAQALGWCWADAEALLPAYAIPYYAGQLNQSLMLPVVPAILLLLLYRLKQHSRMDHA